MMGNKENMFIRPYNKAKDFTYINSWITDARTHALWSANRFSFPLEQDDFHEFLAKNEAEWGDCGYVFMDDTTTRQPVGFCVFSVNESDNSGFLKFIVADASKRGQGLGTRMIQTFMKYAFEMVGVESVKLNVFDVNEGAKRCYEKAGFVVESTAPDALQFEDESWARHRLVIHSNMSDFGINEMQEMQKALQDKYKHKWGELSPEIGKNQLLWMIGEIGEVIDIVKKHGGQKASTDEVVRKDLIEEMADVLMYYNDVMLCYGITANELKESYVGKFGKNMKRW